MQTYFKIKNHYGVWVFMAADNIHPDRVYMKELCNCRVCKE